MRGFALALKLALSVVIAAELVVLYSFFGPDRVTMRYTIAIPEPRSGRIAVTAEIDGQLKPILFLRPLAGPEHTRIRVLGADSPAGGSLWTRWMNGGNLAVFTGFRRGTVLRYEVAPGGLGRHGHQGALLPDFGLVPARVLFLVPRRDGDLGDVLVRFALPPGWTAAHAWEPREGPWLDPRAAGLLGESLERSTLGFGRWHSTSRVIGSTRFEAHAWDGWSTEYKDRVLERATRLFEVVQAHFGLRLRNRFVAVFVPAAPDGRGIIADYWSNGLGLNMDDSPRAWALYVHRLVHVANRDRPYGMHLEPHPRYLPTRDLVNWVNEGATSFLEGWALSKAGIEGADERLDGAWKTYLRNHAPLSPSFLPLARESSMRDRGVRDYLHYEKALLLMQTLDHVLRTRSSGEKDLAGFLARLYASYGRHRAPAPFFDELTRYGGFDPGPFFDRYVVDDDILMPLWQDVLVRYASGPREAVAWVGDEPVLADAGYRSRARDPRRAAAEIARLVDQTLLERELRARDPEAIPGDLLRTLPWLPEPWQRMIARKIREALGRALHGAKGETAEQRLDDHLAQLRQRAQVRLARRDVQWPPLAARDRSAARAAPTAVFAPGPSNATGVSNLAGGVPLTEPEGRCATRLARTALGLYVESGRVLDAAKIRAEGVCPLTGALLERRAAFVTLRRHGRLRGCVGSFHPGALPLWQDIVENAGRAARHDSRYPPVAPEEVDELEVEVSVLGPPQPLSTTAAVRLGRDGLLLEHGTRRALFLPWAPGEYGWDLEATLGQLARKAGLPADAWRRGARLSRFETQDLVEAPPHGAP